MHGYDAVYRLKQSDFAGREPSRRHSHLYKMYDAMGSSWARE